MTVREAALTDRLEEKLLQLLLNPCCADSHIVLGTDEARAQKSDINVVHIGPSHDNPFHMSWQTVIVL